MKKRIADYIPLAIEAVKAVKIEEKDGIPTQFNGYISSFGASVIQSGLIPAVTFYSEKGGAEKDRQKLMEALYRIAFNEGNNSNVVENALLNRILSHRRDSNEFETIKQKIIDAAIALKLALRTFKLKK